MNLSRGDGRGREGTEARILATRTHPLGLLSVLLVDLTGTCTLWCWWLARSVWYRETLGSRPVHVTLSPTLLFLEGKQIFAWLLHPVISMGHGLRLESKSTDNSGEFLSLRCTVSPEHQRLLLGTRGKNEDLDHMSSLGGHWRSNSLCRRLQSVQCAQGR